MASSEITTDSRALVVDAAKPWPMQADALTIRTPVSYRQAADMLLGIKTLRQEVARVFDPHIQAANRAHKALVAEKRQADAPLDLAERVLKQKMAGYDSEQRRIADAAAADARIAEAAAIERAAVATGDAELQAEADALLEAPPPPVATAAPTVAGVSYRTTYRADVLDLGALIAHVSTHPEHRELLTVNQPALNRLARALKTGLKLPGVRVVEDRTVAARAGQETA